MSLALIKGCKITEKKYNNIKEVFRLSGEDINIITRKLREFPFIFLTIPIGSNKYIDYAISL